LSLELVVCLNLVTSSIIGGIEFSQEGTHAQLERTTTFVVKEDLPVVSTLRKMILEDMLAPQGNMQPEFLPTPNANHE